MKDPPKFTQLALSFKSMQELEAQALSPYTVLFFFFCPFTSVLSFHMRFPFLSILLMCFGFFFLTWVISSNRSFLLLTISLWINTRMCFSFPLILPYFSYPFSSNSILVPYQFILPLTFCFRFKQAMQSFILLRWIIFF